MANKVEQVENMIRNIGTVVSELIKENERRLGKVYDLHDSY